MYSIHIYRIICSFCSSWPPQQKVDLNGPGLLEYIITGQHFSECQQAPVSEWGFPPPPNRVITFYNQQMPPMVLL